MPATFRALDLSLLLCSVQSTGLAMRHHLGEDGPFDQRTGVTREDGTQWAWGYNDRGEVTSGGEKFSDGTAQPMLQFGYQYDGIGNRTQSTVASHAATYSPNSRNQYDSRTVPPYTKSS